MKERPILFSAPMVRAILDGRKTQTRRVVKSKPDPHAERVQQYYGDEFDWLRYDGLRLGSFKCPYGKPGDLLWVRETFCKSPDGPIYRASESDAGMLEPDDHIVWKPSIHMPKKYARIWLEVTGIRVERLQDISNQDAVSEGVGTPADIRYAVEDCFRPLWESINGKGSWSENPWVWVVEFQRTDQAKAA